MAALQNAIVVGLNGTPSSYAALHFAAAEAQHRGTALVLVHAWHLPTMTDGAAVMYAPEVRAAEAAVLEDGVERLEELSRDLAYTVELVEGSSAAAALLRASKDAAMVVVGAGRAHPAWLGPTLGHLAAEAESPVVVVPAGVLSVQGPVVVGVDGSEVSMEAVAVGFAQAAAWGSELLAVMSVNPSFDAYAPGDGLLHRILEQGRRELSESLAGWCEKYPDVEVQQLVSVSSALGALQQAGRDARLIVVGSHGRGAVRRAVLGSVSSSLLRDAPCPVAVVRS
jgi:nucleotide-binding universal stress UspA family protein